MSPAQFTFEELTSILRRRRKYVIIPAVLFAVMCSIGAFMLPKKYESSTTIFVQREEVLNPIISFEMAVSLASEDRLSAFNEIVFSQSMIETLIDSLGLAKNITTPLARQDLVREIRGNVKTELRGENSFTITYTDTDPIQAQKAAALLLSIFIQTRLRMETQRDDNAVEFFEKKLEEFRQKFEASQKEVVDLLRTHIHEIPEEDKSLYADAEDIHRQITDTDGRIKEYQQAQAILRSLPDDLNADRAKQALFELERAEIPFVADLRTLLRKYDEYTQRYTPKYPEVQRVGTQIVELIGRMKTAVEKELAKEQSHRWELEKNRNEDLELVGHSTITKREDQDKESSYGIYQRLYDEMKVKLEQARTTRDLGKKGANQYVVLDPARVPLEPTKPNRPLIMLGGTGFGIVIGLLSAAAAELFDTRVRSLRDIEVYNKRVIAFLPDGSGIRSS